MSPHFQAHKGNPDVQGSVKLKTHTEKPQHHLSTAMEIYKLLPSLSAQGTDLRFLFCTRLQGEEATGVPLFTSFRGGNAILSGAQLAGGRAGVT